MDERLTQHPVTADDQVKSYIKKIMSQLNKWMVGGKISKLVVVITSKDTGEHVERWQFDVGCQCSLIVLPTRVPTVGEVRRVKSCTQTDLRKPIGRAPKPAQQKIKLEDKQIRCQRREGKQRRLRRSFIRVRLSPLLTPSPIPSHTLRTVFPPPSNSSITLIPKTLTKDTTSPSSKTDAEIQSEIAALFRQITASVTFLPTLDAFGPCSFNVLVYADADSEVPLEWGDSDAKEIAGGERVALRSFSTQGHRVGVVVGYRLAD